MHYELKPRSTGEILDGAFILYRDHFVALLKLALLVSVPALLVQRAVLFPLTGSLLVADLSRLEGLRHSLATGASGLLDLLTWAVQDAVLIAALGDILTGSPLQPWRRVRRRYASLVLCSILTFTGMVIAIMFFVVPGVLVSVRWALTSQVVVLENRGPWNALKRSAALVEGRGGKVATLMTLWWVIWMSASFGIGNLMPSVLHSIPWVGELLQPCLGSLTAPLGPCVMTLAYLDGRVDREALDLEIAASQSGSLPAVVAPA